MSSVKAQWHYPCCISYDGTCVAGSNQFYTFDCRMKIERCVYQYRCRHLEMTNWGTFSSNTEEQRSGQVWVSGSWYAKCSRTRALVHKSTQGTCCVAQGHSTDILPTEPPGAKQHWNYRRGTVHYCLGWGLYSVDVSPWRP